MSTRERKMHSRITGHTGSSGGSLDAHMEPGIGVPGQFEGPMDGRLSHYAEEVSEALTRGPVRERAAVPPRWATDGNGHPEGRSIAELIRKLSMDSGDLVRQEVELAKAEMREKMTVFSRGTLTMGVGGALLVCALLTGLWALNSGLTALFTRIMGPDVAVWLSPLILTLALGMVGWMTIQGAMARMADEGLTLRRTTATLKADGRWAQARMHEVKEEMTHGR